MLVNFLPARTWNHLKMNETELKPEGMQKEVIPVVVGTSETVTAVEGYDDRENRFSFIGGMGKDTDTFLKNAPITLLSSKENTENAAITMTYSAPADSMGVSRLYLYAKKGSTVRVNLVVESENTSGTLALQTKIYAEENAKVIFSSVNLLGKQFVSLHDVAGYCEKNSKIELIKLELGAGKLYAGTEINLDGEKSEFTADVGYHVRKNQLVDMNYNAVHRGKKTECLMEVSGSLEDGAKKIFRGTIDFKQGSAGAKGTETENVLLLGEGFVNQSIPLILCAEEDVEGNHGASIGQLDSKMLFYLASRGIPMEEAQQIIAKSRTRAICEKIGDTEIEKKVYEFEREYENDERK